MGEAQTIKKTCSETHAHIQQRSRLLQHNGRGAVKLLQAAAPSTLQVVLSLNPEHWPHLQARELADQDWLLFVILTPELVDLCQPVGQVLPAALPVCRHAAWLAAGLTAGTTAGEDTTQYDQHHSRTHRTTRGSPTPGRARQPQNTLRNPVSLPTLTHYYCTLNMRT